jgi:hypothetical protein
MIPPDGLEQLNAQPLDLVDADAAQDTLAGGFEIIIDIGVA